MSSRFTREELVQLIESMEASGKDTTELRAALATLPVPARQKQQSRADLKEEEVSVADRLNARVGDLFPGGINEGALAQFIAIDMKYSLKELRGMCRDAGLGTGGDKKELAAKLVAAGILGKEEQEKKEEPMAEKFVDLSKQKEWEGKPEDVAIPEIYIKNLHHEIIVFARKERGGSDFAFRCKDYQRSSEGAWVFTGVIMDTSKLNPKGEVELARVTYHPKVELVNIGFMVVPCEVAEL